ncbi:MAG TPA: radical SAM protein [Candidatus Eremiobacteraceae bacterium]|nr:radical SAM protein [Candidatus Eremiobacteraceae bacterium]
MTTVRAASASAVFARADGAVLDLPGNDPAADTGSIGAARLEDFIPLPKGSLLLTLPGRSPLAWENGASRVIDAVDGVAVDAVAAALPLGYTRIALPAYVERSGAPPLPLYGYAAVIWHRDRFCAAAMRTDHLEAWDPAAHQAQAVNAGIETLTKKFPASGLLRQLRRCATEYGCFTAQNAFLGIGEAAIPISPACNARCIGCISEQEPDAGIPSAQARVRTIPPDDDVVRFAAAHLDGASGTMVSFGQGCEGEPLLAAARIAGIIRAIRAKTGAGLIHCNTNASLPAALAELFAAGLQSIRVSLNAARPESYAAYYRPRGYSFDDVRASLRVAATAGAAISLNLLTHPGVTDDPDEMAAFDDLLREHPIDMVQTRTLNVDPSRYFAAVGRPRRKPAGMRAWFAWLRERHPRVRLGNFTRGFG